MFCAGFDHISFNGSGFNTNIAELHLLQNKFLQVSSFKSPVNIMPFSKRKTISASFRTFSYLSTIIRPFTVFNCNAPLPAGGIMEIDSENYTLKINGVNAYDFTGDFPDIHTGKGLLNFHFTLVSTGKINLDTSLKFKELYK